MKKLHLWNWLFFSSLILILIGCGGSGSNSTAGSTLPIEGTGTLSLSLTDATTNEYKAAYVTIEEVQVHMADGEPENGWQVVATPNKTFNLLELVNGIKENLGITELEAGHYTQMRLIIGDTPDDGINILSELHPYANYIIQSDNETKELKIPSGYNTGIKIVHGFDINEGEITELILDFDASKSIVKAGKSGKWLLKPTIKVIGTQENSIVSGIITDAGSLELLEGVLVTAQIYNPDAVDKKDEVVIEASTITDENGEYKLFLLPGTYNIVAYTDGYIPVYEKVTTESNSTFENDLSLNTALTGNLTGTVDITDGSAEQHVTISVRQSVMIDGSEEEIEIKSINVVNGALYETLLPVEDYTVVASTFDKETQEHSISIVVDTDTLLDLSF
ncbi:MAG: DUF4382 domain-containing protein [Thermodesulfovibrionia bacterium]